MSDYNFHCPNSRYEYMASLFYKRTGIMAPGKDDPIGCHDRSEREAEWVKFLEEYYAEAAKAHFELNLKKDKE